MMDLSTHGGPDSGPAITHDFSSNANPLGAPDSVLLAIQSADRARYPDPNYQALRESVGASLGMAPWRVLPTAGSSEAIRRLTLAAHLQGVRRVWVPQPGYGDYRAAALALGMNVQGYDSGYALLSSLTAQREPALVWLCEPCNPTGQSLPASFWSALADLKARQPLTLVLDRAYEPLRLMGDDPVPTALADQCWQLCSPNKALGLTGVRAGYVIAPLEDATKQVSDLLALAPSWVLSAEGVAMLQAWHQPETQAWLARSRHTLALWIDAQRTALNRLGWDCSPSVVPFMLAQAPSLHREAADVDVASTCLQPLRAQGIKLRDASSFGLPGWVRLSAQAPHAQQALFKALAELKATT